MHKLSIPHNVTWELLIVNNNCTDDTDIVIAKHEGHLPIRRLFELRSGKSFALNHAVGEARGEYIVWTDDDVLVDPNWIVAYSQAFVRWPNASIFGGGAQPWFDGTAPTWLQCVWPQVANAYAMRDFGAEPLRLNQDRVPFGLNLAIRTADQRRFLYDPSLGPPPNSSSRGEDTTLVRRMLAEGAEGWWVPSASVRHFVPKERQTIGYIRSYFFGYGQYLAREGADQRERKFFRQPTWVWRAIEGELKFQLGRFARKPELWIEDLKKAGKYWGRIYGSIWRP